MDSRSISSRGEWVEEGVEACITNVYGPNVDRERDMFWTELEGTKFWAAANWCVGGDFNAIRFPSEKKGGRGYTSTMEAFFSCIENCELIDLPLIGGRFTWSNGQMRGVLSRLDRFLISAGWESLFMGASQVKLYCTVSDHCPILFYSVEIDWGPRPFRFNNAWLLDPKFINLLKSWWIDFNVYGRAGFVLSKKLKLLKWKIKDWAASHGGSVSERKDLALRDLELLDKIEEERDLEEGDMATKKKAKSLLWNCLRIEKVEWRQKSRALWLQEGDKNTKFFHSCASNQNAINIIRSVVVGGKCLSDKASIREAVVKFFIFFGRVLSLRLPLSVQW